MVPYDVIQYFSPSASEGKEYYLHFGSVERLCNMLVELFLKKNRKKKKKEREKEGEGLLYSFEYYICSFCEVKKNLELQKTLIAEESKYGKVSLLSYHLTRTVVVL
jgi:hypothetical protein